MAHRVLIFGFSRQYFSVALESILELALVDQAGLKLTEIQLPLSPPGFDPIQEENKGAKVATISSHCTSSPATKWHQSQVDFKLHLDCPQL